MQKNKILLILHYPPPIHGAAIVGQYIRDSHLVNSSFNTEYLKLGTSDSLDEIGQGSFIKIIRYLFLIMNTINKLIQFRPDLVYITLTAKGSGFYKDALISFIVKLSGCKIVYHFHNKGISTRQDKLLDNILYKYIFKNTDVILLSMQLYIDIQKYIALNRVHICPNGIPDINFENKKSIKVPIQILFISNLIKSKGINELIKSCKVLLERGNKFICEIVGMEGDVSKDELLKTIKTYGLEKVVKLLGPKYGDEKYEILSHANIFAFPTYYHNECFPLVLLEAMQYSLPIVSTNEGGIPDIIENDKTGYLIKQKDVIGLAEKLELLIKNRPLRLRMGKESRNRYIEKFTLEKFEIRFVKIIDDIISTNKLL